MSETGLVRAAIPPHHISICTPSYTGDTCDEHKMSLLEMSRQDEISWEYRLCTGVNPGLCRNLLVSNGETTLHQTLRPDITHYLFVDADVSWHPEHIAMLMRHNVPVVSGSYISRHGNGRFYEAGMWDVCAGDIGDRVLWGSKGLNQVDWVGGGFVLATREALQTLEHPWWRHEIVRYLESTQAGLIAHSIEVEEDIGLCLNCAAHQIPVMLDCDCYVQHKVEWEMPTRMTPVVKEAHCNTAPVFISNFADSNQGST